MVKRFGSFLGGQVGGMGVLVFVLLAIAVFLALRATRRTGGTGGRMRRFAGGGGGSRRAGFFC